MSVRIRRLKGDMELIGRSFPPDGRIRIQETRGDPPDRYTIEYHLAGLEQAADGKIRRRETHLVAVTLTLAYPRQAPHCRMLTPVFHPNIAPHAVCVGDHWAAGESLAHLLVRIAEMITWQSYNTKSPLNGDAARWADRNAHRLPVDPVDLTGYYEVREGARTMAALPCAQCGSRDGVDPCVSGHPACNLCRLPCAECETAICPRCPSVPCFTCAGATCPGCGAACGNCRRVACPAHRGTCRSCGRAFCADCGDACAACAAFLCLEHAGAAPCPHGGAAVSDGDAPGARGSPAPA
jgi:ubiquitin-protein ligase